MIVKNITYPPMTSDLRVHHHTISTDDFVCTKKPKLKRHRQNINVGKKLEHIKDNIFEK